MVSDWIKNKFFGSVKIVVTGKLLSPLLNQLNRAGIPLWNVQRLSGESISFVMNIKDFRRFRIIAKETDSKFTIKKKDGLPFINWRLQRRYMFLAGFLFFLLFLWTMSQIIWDISIVGHDGKHLPYENEKIIRSELAGLGIKQGTWKFRVPEKDIVQNQLREQLQHDYIWVGMEIQGTRMTIIAVPLSKPKEEETLLIPSNLISTKQAVIHRILVYDGVGYVREGQRVYPGQILVSGYIGAEKKIPAKGVVEGIVWYTVDVELPIERIVETYTGDTVKKYRIVMKNWSVPLFIPKQLEKLTGHDLKTTVKSLSWRSLRLPIELHVDTYYETHSESIYIDENKAKDMAVSIALEKVVKQENVIEVVSHTIMKYNVDNEQVYVRMLIEVIEDITARKIMTDDDIPQD